MLIKRKSQVKVCQNHLGELYQAIKDNNLVEVKKVEHELSKNEECVACSYILKSKTEAGEALKLYLIQQGICKKSDGFESEDQKGGLFDAVYHWTLRAWLLITTFIITIIAEQLIRNLIFINTNSKIKPGLILPFSIQANMFELIAILSISFLLFMIIDDLVLD